MPDMRMTGDACQRENIILDILQGVIGIKFQGDGNVCKNFSFHDILFHVRFRHLLEPFCHIKGRGDTRADNLSCCWRFIC